MANEIPEGEILGVVVCACESQCHHLKYDGCIAQSFSRASTHNLENLRQLHYNHDNTCMRCDQGLTSPSTCNSHPRRDSE